MTVLQFAQVLGMGFPLCICAMLSYYPAHTKDFTAFIGLLVMIFVGTVATIVVTAIKDAIKEQS